MALGDDARRARNEAGIPTEMATAAIEIIPQLQWSGGASGRQQWKVIKTFLYDDEDKPKYSHGKILRSADAARLDRAWTAVAEDEDVSEATIRQAGVQYYESTDEQDATEQFLKDLRSIEAVYRQTSSPPQ
jgi:hypothetical protein